MGMSANPNNSIIMNTLSFPKPSSSTVCLLLLPVGLLALTFLVVYPNDFALQSAISGSCRESTRHPPTANIGGLNTSTQPDLHILVGVLTCADRYERRALVRLAYALQPRPHHTTVDVRFVVCAIGIKEEDAQLIALEAMQYGDIVSLSCTENMDSGKTYTYFSSLPSILLDCRNGNGTGTDCRNETVMEANPPYDYVLKVDDDAYFRLDNLVAALREKPREDMYLGFATPCHADWELEKKWMSGMGYAVSWDIVAWIAATTELRNDVRGPEDMLFGRWLRWGGKGKNKYNAGTAMYDFWESGMVVSCSQHPLAPDTIAVHRLKDRRKWALTLKYFNVTLGLKPSKLFHLVP